MKLFNKIKNLFKKEAEKREQLVDVKWDDTIGILKLNGSVHLPHTKQIWFGGPDDRESPNMESITPDEHYPELKYFTEKINEPSKIPFSDFIEMKEKLDALTAWSSRNVEESYYKNLYENAEKTLFQMKKIKRANEKVVEKIMKYEENRIKAQPAFKSTIHGK